MTRDAVLILTPANGFGSCDARTQVVLLSGCHKEHKDRKEGRERTWGIFVVYEFLVAIPIRKMPTNRLNGCVPTYPMTLAAFVPRDHPKIAHRFIG